MVAQAHSENDMQCLQRSLVRNEQLESPDLEAEMRALCRSEVGRFGNSVKDMKDRVENMENSV